MRQDVLGITRRQYKDFKGINIGLVIRINISCFSMICGLNIHYGFIGKAVGFTEWELTAGAGVAQLKDNNRNLGAWVSQYIQNRIRKLWDADFLAAFDDASDIEGTKTLRVLLILPKRSLFRWQSPKTTIVTINCFF